MLKELENIYNSAKLKIESILKSFQNNNKIDSIKQYADCLVWYNNKFLILLRSNQDDFEPSKWCLPGGKIEDDEESDDAVIREIYEETGLTIKVPILNTLKEVDGAKIFIYEASVENGDLGNLVLDNDEHINYAWIEPKNICDYDFLLDLEDTLEAILLKPHQSAFNKIKKAFNQNIISDEDFLQALNKYNEFEKAMVAGSITGTETINKPTSGESLKKESIEKTVGKKNNNLDKLIEEHKNLIDVLESPSHEDDKEEAKKQSKELEEYENKKIEKAQYKETSFNIKRKIVGKEYIKKQPEYKKHPLFDKYFEYNKENECYMDNEGNVLNSDEVHSFIDSKIKHLSYKQNQVAKSIQKSINEKQRSIYSRAVRKQLNGDVEGDLKLIYEDITKKTFGEDYFNCNKEKINKSFLIFGKTRKK